MKHHLLPLLTLGFAVTASAVQSAASFRLDFLPVSIYRQGSFSDQAVVEDATLDPYKGVVVRSIRMVNRPANLPQAYYGLPLISTATWVELAKLGPDALSRFALSVGPFIIDGVVHHVVLPRDDADVSTGPLVNLSTRAWVGTDVQSVVGGFVIEDRPRTVLIRGVGPGLAGFGVTDALADPVITLFKGTTPFLENINWQSTDPAEKAEAARVVGAFALEPGSKDAVLLVELEPASYTVRLAPATGGPGVALLEVYTLPDSSLLPHQ